MPRIVVSIKAESRYCVSGMTVQNRPEYSLYFPRKDFDSCVIRRTREEIHEETGISVKTLNRTIRKLKESGMVGITIPRPQSIKWFLTRHLATSSF